MIIGTRTINPQKPNTTEGIPARSSMNREYSVAKKGGAYHWQKRAEHTPIGPARKMAPIVVSNVPKIMGTRLKESSPGCQDASKTNRSIPMCRSAGTDSIITNKTMKTRISPAMQAQHHSVTCKSWSRCQGYKGMLSDQVVNLRRYGKRNKRLSQCLRMFGGYQGQRARQREGPILHRG